MLNLTCDTVYHVGPNCKPSAKGERPFVVKGLAGGPSQNSDARQQLAVPEWAFVCRSETVCRGWADTETVGNTTSVRGGLSIFPARI